MGFFGSKKEGGIMDVIRCDEKDFLIWKWSPDGVPSRKENAIRYGSSLRVKDGEVAVFVYKQSDGTMQDFIEGPYDQTIKTSNFPVLTSIVGTAFGGASPFQAEIYFINLSGNIQLPFFIDEFDVFDPRLQDLAIPVTVKGAITFNISDYPNFIKLNRMLDFDAEEFLGQIKPAIKRYVKSVVVNAPIDAGIPVIQIERKIEAITSIVEDSLKKIMARDYGVNVKRVDISAIDVNKNSYGYLQLKAVTIDIQSQTLKAQSAVNITNMADQQAIAVENLQESLKIQREETQRAQRLQTESSFLSAHQINVQGDVAKTAAQSLGELGSSGGMDMGSGGGFNPAGMMTGMMMGGVVGSSMSNMMGGMMSNLNQPQPPQPPVGVIAQYHVSINGQQAGPFTVVQLQQMVEQGSLTPSTYIWKQGMGGWDFASNVAELAPLFQSTPPPLPPPIKIDE